MDTFSRKGLKYGNFPEYMKRLSNAGSIAEEVARGAKINSEKIIDEMSPLIDYFKENPRVLRSEERALGKNIALIIPYHPLYETGGLEIGTRKFAEGLTKLGNHVEIISRGVYAEKDLTGPRKTTEGIIIQGVGSGIEEIVPYILRRHSDFDIVQWMEIFPPVPELETVFNSKAEQQYLASIILRALGIHTFLYVATSGNVTNRGVNNPKWGNMKKQRFNEFAQIGMCGFVAINSEISEEYKRAGINISPENYEVVPFGVDTDMFKPVTDVEKMVLRRLLKLPEDKVLFICPGRFVKRKKQDLLFSIWKNLPKNIRESANLLFVGGKAGQGQPDSNYESLMEEINKYSATGHDDVHTVGLVSQNKMVEYIQASDAMIFPSEREGLGMVVLETMASGKPVFASNISGVRDIIKDQDIGTFFEPNNRKQIENCINFFLLSSDKYRKRALKARPYIVTDWGWESISKKLNEFYRSH